jgi:hypothetical protein
MYETNVVEHELLAGCFAALQHPLRLLALDYLSRRDFGL